MKEAARDPARDAALAATPDPPYYAVIFTSRRKEGDAGYGAMAGRMEELAAQQPGYLGIESVRGQDGVGVTISYWKDLDSVRHWKQNLEHLAAQQSGRDQWYQRYRVRVCKVERDYGFEARG